MNDEPDWPGPLRVHIDSLESGPQWISLLDALTCDESATFAHPMAYLDVPMIQMAAGVVQYAVDMVGGIDEKDWAAVVFDGEPLPDALLDAVRGLTKPDQGFALDGDAAFMQIPAPWVVDVPMGPIDGLFEPLRDRLGASSKALRLPARPMTAICPSCAAQGVFLNHQYSNAKSQFWGASPLRGAMTMLARFDGKPAGLRRTLLANVIHRDAPEWRAPQPLPWLPNVLGNNGLDEDSRAPFEKYLTPPESLDAPANLALTLIRGLRLGPVHEQRGRCGCCGAEDQPLYSAYAITPEPAMLARMAPATQKALKGEKSKVLSKMLLSTAQHPHIGYQIGKDGESRVPLGFYTDGPKADKALPTWIVFADSLKDDLGKPAILRQLGRSEENHELTAQLDVALFGVTFIGATNPNIRAVFNDQYGFAANAWSAQASQPLSHALGQVSGAVVASIRTWAEAALCFDYDTKRERDRQGVEQIIAKVPPSSRLKSARRYLHSSGSLHALADQLWETAFATVAPWLTNPALLQGEAGEALRDEAIQRILTAATHLWQHYQQQRVAADDRLDTLFLATEAQKQHNKSRRKELKSRGIAL